jgi:hypothetical protein
MRRWPLIPAPSLQTGRDNSTKGVPIALALLRLATEWLHPFRGLPAPPGALFPAGGLATSSWTTELCSQNPPITAELMPPMRGSGIGICLPPLGLNNTRYRVSY